jgi:hypothetical protein
VLPEQHQRFAVERIELDDLLQDLRRLVLPSPPPCSGAPRASGAAAGRARPCASRSWCDVLRELRACGIAPRAASTSAARSVRRAAARVAFERAQVGAQARSSSSSLT